MNGERSEVHELEDSASAAFNVFVVKDAALNSKEDHLGLPEHSPKLPAPGIISIASSRGYGEVYVSSDSEQEMDDADGETTPTLDTTVAYGLGASIDYLPRPPPPSNSITATDDRNKPSFDASKITPVLAIEICLNPAMTYLQRTPPKACRTNMVYSTTSNLDDITTDDNGAYSCLNHYQHDYFVDGNYKAQIVRYNDTNGYYVNFRNKRQYDKKTVPEDAIYSCATYKKQCKSQPSLMMQIFTVTKVKEGRIMPVRVVTYEDRRGSDTGANIVDDFDTGATLPHGNSASRTTSCYYRTSAACKGAIKSALSITSKPSAVYDSVIRDSGGALGPESVSDQPRNLQQIYNSGRNTKGGGSTGTSSASASDDLQKLRLCQMDDRLEGFVRSIIVERDSYMVFLASDEQIEGLGTFCCQDEGVLSIDITFKLTSFWLTDTCFRNTRLIHRRSRKHPVWPGPSMLHFRKDQETFSRFAVEILKMLCSSGDPEVRNLHCLGTDQGCSKTDFTWTLSRPSMFHK